ncbi:hypothetical protein [Skermania sp. ID1734]|uniref:hypothetical protein n=1 Tax=Skermania sp. ID1734 TaxID=2597516 RepID=UPI00163D4C58|nr:hypothetical protein [Skermania sp. ID1734]
MTDKDFRVFGNGHSWTVRMRCGTHWEPMGRYQSKADAVAAKKRLRAEYGN